MCSLCAGLGGSRYWTDAAGQDAFRRHGRKVTLRSEREERVRLLDRVLGVYGVTIKDWGGNSYLLEDSQGRRQNVYNLAGIWEVLDRMTGRPCDPLDPVLLEHLSNPLETRE